jgi:glucosamine--fructose-6-phosphate aminotransferase (isomerizing)
LHDSLPIQAGLATEFVTQAWPSLLEQALGLLRSRRKAISSVLLCGCGDSHFAAQGAEFGLRLWTARRVRAASSMLGGRYLIDGVDSTCLMVGISASGEVARTVEALEQGRRAGAPTLALTCEPNSTLANEAVAALAASLPEHPFGPGLISYLASLLGLFAIAAALADESARRRLTSLVSSLPAWMADSADDQAEQGRTMAERVGDARPGVFLGSGPGYGAAGYAAAKVIETCGLDYHAQDVEEWAHLEYFGSDAQAPTWILTSGGRDASRVAEVEHAARAIGRSLAITRWGGNPEWSSDEREALSPFGLWPAPVAFAHRLMQLLGEEPFRSFGGGRGRAEGGGPSRIRTSQRLAPRQRAGVARTPEPYSHWHCAGTRL